MKKIFLVLLSVLLIINLTFVLASASENKSSPQPLLIINGTPVITDVDFHDYLMRFEAKFKFRPTIDRQKDILNLFANEELLYLEAIKKGYTKDDELLARFNILKEKGYGSNLTLPKQDEWLKKRFFAEHYLNEFRNNLTKITDDELKDYYEKNKIKYFEPESFTGFFYIIQPLKASADEKALKDITEKVKSMIVENNYLPIEALSMHNFNQQNPNFNVVLYKTLRYDPNNPKKKIAIPDEAVKDFIKLTPKTLAITKVNNDYIISVLNEKSDARILSFEDAKLRARADLTVEKDKTAVKELFDSLRRANKIVVNYELLK